MKKKSLILLILITASMVLATPVSAKKGVVYKAQGSWEEYDPGNVHAEIVGGHWNIEIRMVDEEYVIQWHSQHRELNLGGDGAHEYDQAVGTVDHFKYYFSDVYSVEISDDACILEVNLWVHAKHHDPETGRPYWHWLEYGFRVIEINQDRIRTSALTGPTHTLK